MRKGHRRLESRVEKNFVRKTTFLKSVVDTKFIMDFSYFT